MILSLDLVKSYLRNINVIIYAPYRLSYSNFKAYYLSFANHTCCFDSSLIIFSTICKILFGIANFTDLSLIFGHFKLIFVNLVIFSNFDIFLLLIIFFRNGL